MWRVGHSAKSASETHSYHGEDTISSIMHDGRPVWMGAYDPFQSTHSVQSPDESHLVFGMTPSKANQAVVLPSGVASSRFERHI